LLRECEDLRSGNQPFEPKPPPERTGGYESYPRDAEQAAIRPLRIASPWLGVSIETHRRPMPRRSHAGSIALW